MSDNTEQKKILNLLEISKRRWDSLDKTMEFFIRYIENEKVQMSRKRTLQHLVKCLQIFAENQFFFFLDGFGNHVKGYKPVMFENLKLELPQPSGDFPLPYVFRVTLNQTANDLDIIQRAAGQRILVDVIQWADGQRILAIDSKIGSDTLKNADRLAQNALDLAKNWLPEGPTTAVTYFQKSASIRVIPYAPVALIAIPYKATRADRDYLAIAHELGHAVYWHGKVGHVPIREIMKSIVDEQSQSNATFNKVFRRWTEEICADIYGCLVAGPVIALDFQDLQLESSRAEFVEDDRKHAVPLLRPYIYTEVLKKIGLPKWSDALKTRWETELTERINDSSQASQTNINLSEACGIIATIIDKAFALLPHQFDKLARWSGAYDLPEDADTTAEIEKLYPDFEKKFRFNESDSGPGGPDVLSSEPDLTCWDWDEWVKQVGGFKSDSDGKPIFPTDPVKEGTWIQVLAAAGWTTGGPSSHD